MEEQLPAQPGMVSWLRYFIAFLVFFHGWVYIPFALTIHATIKEWKGTSWLLGGLVTPVQLNLMVRTFHLLAGIVIILCGVAIALAPNMQGWWCPLAVVGALLGLTAFLVFWDGQFSLLVREGAIGVIICLVMLIGAISLPNAFD